MSQCTNWQQTVGCMGCMALDMVSYSTGFSCQWNMQSVFPTVGYKTFILRNMYFCCCIPRLFSIMWSLYKKKGEVSEIHLWQWSPGPEWTDPTRRAPEHRRVTAGSTVTTHGRLKAHLCFLWIIGSVICKGYVELLISSCPQESHGFFNGFSGAKC